jgi:hypothetical protein
MSRELSQLAEAHAAVLRQVDALSARVKALEASGACPADACAARAPGVAEGRELAEAEKVRQADEVPGPHGGLRLPDAAELAVVLETALKNGITVRAADPDRAPCLDDLSAFHGSPLLDDAGDVVGLVLGDPGTVVRLGGALMGLDDSRLQEELVAETLSEDLVACASELFATLATVIDGVRGNVHVRAGFLEALSPDAHPWTASPASRLDLEDSRGARLVILAR